MNWVGNSQIARVDNTAYMPNNILNSGNYGEAYHVFNGHDVGGSAGAGPGIDGTQTQFDVPHGTGYWEGGKTVGQDYSFGYNADPVPNAGVYLGGATLTLNSDPVNGSMVQTLNSANGMPLNYSFGAGEILNGQYYRSINKNISGQTVFTITSTRIVLGVSALPVTAAMGTTVSSSQWRILGGPMNKWDSVEAAYYNAIKPVYGWEDSLKTKGFTIEGLAPIMK